MRVVSDLCDHVYVLAAGAVIADGTPEEIQQDDAVITSYLGRGRAVNE
jgi:ABC-type branched-subunit amino acid transport system ATPase component